MRLRYYLASRSNCTFKNLNFFKKLEINNFLIFFYRFDMLILKIKKIKNIILMYLQAKIILKNNIYNTFKQALELVIR